MRTIIGAFAASVALSSVAASYAQVNLAYTDPAGGWKYAFKGDAAAGGSPGTADIFDALDGQWDRTTGGDSWAGDAIGGTLAKGTNPPGGISALTEGATNFIRIQDTGDPRTLGFADETDGNPAGVGSNRRVGVGRTLANDGVTTTFLDTGVTLSFRTRLSTAATGIIDGQYVPATGAENAGTAAGAPWQAGGNGELAHDGGKGNFIIRQNTDDKSIAFSLNLASDLRSDNATPFGLTGLNMNSIMPAADRAVVDPFQNEGTINHLAMTNLTDWHEFWITIKASNAGAGELGTHRVEVYKDGSTTPNVFFVTAGNGNDYNVDFMGMSATTTVQQSAYDVDFFSYKEGLLVPTAAGGGGPTGKFDADNDVDGNDFLVWQRTDNTVAGLTAIKTNFGQVIASAIPEPNSGALIALAALGLLPRRARSGA